MEIGPLSIVSVTANVSPDVTIGNFCEVLDGCEIGSGTILQSRVRLGPHCIIGKRVIFKCGAIIANFTHIDDDAFIGPNVICLGGGPDRNRIEGAYIGKNCYIGAGAKIVAGVIIVDDVIIGANSFVTKDITEPGTYAGTPVRRLK